MTIKEKTQNGVARAFRFFLQDLENLPEGAFDRSLGGKARTVADIAYEVRLTNERLCRDLSGQPSAESPNAWVVAPADIRAKEAVISSFRASSEQVLRLIEQLSPEELEEVVPGVLGEASRADHCRAMTVHLWYHSGQLNFIQTLLGDSEIHWS